MTESRYKTVNMAIAIMQVLAFVRLTVFIIISKGYTEIWQDIKTILLSKLNNLCYIVKFKLIGSMDLAKTAAYDIKKSAVRSRGELNVKHNINLN